MRCPDEARIQDWMERRLDEEHNAALRAHLARCDDCRRLVAETARSVVADREADPGAAEILIGRYVLLERLGSGSMGVVHLAYDPQLDREVAIKLIHPLGSVPAEQLAGLLLSEAQAMARLAHPAIVAVFDAGFTDEEQVYIVMELVRGTTLRHWLGRPGTGWRDVVDCYLQAGQGLAAAHDSGVVHGDFKPDNVLIGEHGRVQVSDLGLARPLRERGQAQTKDKDSAPRGAPQPAGPLSGTPAYMAPELLDGGLADTRSDQFSFCASLYEGLYGQRPFSGSSLEALAAQIRAGQIHASPDATKVPRRVRAVVLRGLEVKPEARFASMEDLLKALRRARYQGRRRAAAAAGLFFLSALAGLMYLGLRQAQPPCSVDKGPLRQVWSLQRRHTIEQAFAGSGLSFAADAARAVSRAIEARLALWQQTRRELCQSTFLRGEHGPGQYRRGQACLDQQLQQLHALLDVFADADRDVVTRSIDAVLELPAPSVCLGSLGEAAPPPTGTGERAPEANNRAQRQALARAAALEKAGRYAEARQQIDALMSRPQRADDPVWETELLALSGRVAGRRGEVKRAAADLQAAAEMALASDQQATAARVYVDLMFFVGHAQARFRDARRWRRLAQLAMNRSGPQLELHARLLEVSSIVLWDQGELDQAQDALERARDIYAQVYGPRDPRVAHCLDGLATLLLDRGELTPALALDRQAVTIAEETFGPWHPTLLGFLNNLGNTLALLGRYDEARAALTRALSIAEEVLGREHLDLVPPLDSLGSVLSLMGLYTEAIAQLERAASLLVAADRTQSVEYAVVLSDLAGVQLRRGRLAQAREHLDAALALLALLVGRQHPQYGVTLCRSGDVDLARGRPRSALETFQRALTLIEQQQGPESPAAAAPLTGLGRALLAMGEAETALAPLRRAVELRSSRAGEPRDLASSRFALARALVESGRDRPAGTRLARQALQSLAQRAWPDPLIAELRIWLDAHPAPPATAP